MDLHCMMNIDKLIKQIGENGMHHEHGNGNVCAFDMHMNMVEQHWIYLHLNNYAKFTQKNGARITIILGA